MSDSGQKSPIEPPIAAQSNAGGASRSQMFQNVPQRSELARNENAKTNPPRVEHPPDALLPRQLAAARALAQGQRVPAVAEQLGTTRQTINRWRRDPRFAVEVQRLHELILRQSPGGATQAAPPPPPAQATAPPSVPAPPQDDPASDAEAAAFEARMEAALVRAHGKAALCRVSIQNGKMIFRDY